MKKTLITLTAGLLLVGCSSPTLESYQSTTSLARHLECDTTKDDESDSAWCVIGGNEHLLLILDDPVGYANMYLDASKETAVGVGENWSFVCGSNLTDDECASIVESVGGTLVKG